MRPVVLPLLLSACAGEWHPAAGAPPPPPVECKEARARALDSARGPMISGWALVAAGAAAGVGSGVTAAIQTQQYDPVYWPSVVIGVAAVVLLAIGAPIAYSGYSQTVEALPECPTTPR